MNGLSIVHPNVTLYLDLEGVIQRASLSDLVPGEDAEAWRGRRWAETVGEPGDGDVQRILFRVRRAQRRGTPAVPGQSPETTATMAERVEKP